MFVQPKLDFASIAPQTKTLSMVLKDDAKVLSAIIDHAQGIYKEYRKTQSRLELETDDRERGRCNPMPTLESLNNWLASGPSAVSDVTWDPRLLSPTAVLEDRRKRALQRQAKRLLNFHLKVVSQLIDDSRKAHPNYRQAMAEMAMGMTQHLAVTLGVGNSSRAWSPGPQARCVALRSRAKTRLGELWLESARADQQLAEELQSKADLELKANVQSKA